MKTKTLSDYMAMPYRMEIVEDKDEGGFVVSYPDLPGCMADGRTPNEAFENVKNVISEWIETARAASRKIPETSFGIENF